MKLLYLTVLQRVLTEEAEKRLDEYEELEHEELTDSYGRTAEYYSDLGIPKPAELKDKEKELEITDDDYDVIATDCVVKLDNFSMALDSVAEEDYNCTVFLLDGTFVKVAETAEEIDFQIKYLTRTKWEKFKAKIKKLKLWKKE